MSARPRSNWGLNEPSTIPAPWAEGDVVDIPEGAKALERMRGMGPGRYKVVGAYSIGEGDDWYFRVGKWLTKGPVSDRLHVFGDPDREDWLEGCALVRTVDPDGLAERQRMLAEGWTPPPPPKRCVTCGQVIP